MKQLKLHIKVNMDIHLHFNKYLSQTLLRKGREQYKYFFFVGGGRGFGWVHFIKIFSYLKGFYNAIFYNYKSLTFSFFGGGGGLRGGLGGL